MKVLVAACDTFRPAAIEQLKTLCGQIQVDCYSEDGVKDPIQIAQHAIEKARRESYAVVVIDTAGRLAVDQALMDEISALHQAVKPTETLFVVDAMTGQDAVETAKAFNDRLDFDGVVLTKMDGDTRGGAALSIKAVVGKPIKFVSSGEKMEALDIFYPKRIADRILGMGDVVTLVEKAQEQFDEEEARKLHKKIARDQFTLQDFYDQIQQIKKMGNIKDLASMIPGVGRALKDVDIDNSSFKQTEAIILSMTPYEKENPTFINGSRRKRIAAGSGTTLADVNRLLKQFETTRKTMKTMTTQNPMAGGVAGDPWTVRETPRRRGRGVVLHGNRKRNGNSVIERADSCGGRPFHGVFAGRSMRPAVADVKGPSPATNRLAMPVGSSPPYYN